MSIPRGVCMQDDTRLPCFFEIPLGARFEFVGHNAQLLPGLWEKTGERRMINCQTSCEETVSLTIIRVSPMFSAYETEREICYVCCECAMA